MADDSLKIETMHTGDELYYMSKDGVLHCIVVMKENMRVQVQNIDRPREKLWLTASQLEFECTTKQEMEMPSEPTLDEEDQEELKDSMNGNPFAGHEEDDPADWWKRGQ